MESGAASLLAALAGEGEGEEAATASRLLRRRAAPRVPRSIWGEGSGRGQLSVLKVHSEPLLTGKRTLPEAGRRTNLKASLQPISPSAKGTLSEAINLERLSTFPRHRADDAALPYLRRQPQLLSQLQVYADVELKARGVGGARAGEPTNAASFEVWREVFARFIEAFSQGRDCNPSTQACTASASPCAPAPKTAGAKRGVDTCRGASSASLAS